MLDQGKVVLLIVHWAIVPHFQLFPLRLRSAQLGVRIPTSLFYLANSLLVVHNYVVVLI